MEHGRDTVEAIDTMDELADVTGTGVAALEDWQRLGLLPAGEGPFTAADVERVRVLRFLERRGVAAEAVARATEDQGDVLGEHVDSLRTLGAPRPPRSLDEAGAAAGLDPAVLGRLWTAAGLGDQDEAYDEDLEALRLVGSALQLGMPEDALAQILRVMADALGRVADANARLFHYYVHERLRADGLAGPDLAAATRAIGDPLSDLIEPAVLYFHRKAYQRAVREDLLLHLAGDRTVPSVPGETEATILFVDLAGFTPLTQAMGDAAAAGLMERFSDLVRAAARGHHGRVVKQIGDEFMLAFTEPAAAVSCALEIEATTSAEPQFPAVRQGIHTGTVLYREGDYFGTTVNLAARVVAEAARHELLVTAAVRAAGTVPDAELVPVGPRRLKGVAAPVELFRVCPTLGCPSSRLIDPVCLMELGPDGVAARLTWHDTELVFCSDECLQHFVADPDRFLDPAP